MAREIDGCLQTKPWILKDGGIVHTNVALTCHRRVYGPVEYFAAMVEVANAPASPNSGEGKLGPGSQVLSGREREVTRLNGPAKR